MLISIDHGNKQIKTTHTLFTSGLYISDTQPFEGKVLKYGDKFYSVSGRRLPYQRDKTTSESFFVLSLFAIASEIKTSGCYQKNDLLDVQLAVGLPPAHYGALKDKFAAYFLGRDIISFDHCGRPFNIFIDDVAVFPQGFSAASTIIEHLVRVSKATVVDIGGYTVDYLIMFNGRPELSQCGSLEAGIIMLYNGIIEGVSGEMGFLLDDRQIDAILAKEEHGLPDEIVRYVMARVDVFVDNLLAQFRERQIDLQTVQPVFTGGGALLLKPYIQKRPKLERAIFIDDIQANAKGYELLYLTRQKKA